MGPEPDSEQVRIRRIVVGVDGSVRSRRALQAGAELALRLKAELEGLLVEEEDWYRMESYGFGRLIGAYTGVSRPAERPRIARELRSQARRVEALVRDLARSRELQARFRSERGRPDQVLRRAAAEADLVIVAHLGRGRGGVRALGTTARALVRECDTPLLLLPEGRGTAGRILWVTDGSQASERAGRVAKQLGAQLVPVERVPADDPGSLVDRVGAPGPPPMIVAARGLPHFAPDRIARTLAVLRVPLLLV